MSPNRMKPLTPVRTLRGLIHWVNDEYLIASKGSTLLESRDSGNRWRKVLTLPVGRAAVVARSTWMTRLLRLGVHHVVPWEDDTITIFGFGRIFVANMTTGQLLVEPRSVIGSRPLSVARCANEVFYGEYRGNAERSPVRVFRSSDAGRSWETAWEFTGVRHVHAVMADDSGSEVWVTTGDEDHECGIWRTTDGFRTLDCVLSGGQQCRAVRLLFTREHVYFGTDSPKEQNWIYKLDRRTGSVTKLVSVVGPIFYGCQVNGSLFFATVCEPTDVNRNQFATVWGGTDGGNRWRKVLSFRKDFLPMRLFQYGQVLFPAGKGCDHSLWLTPFATQCDQISLCYSLREIVSATDE